MVGIIGLGLFSFIAEEAFRSCESTKNNERQQIAEVLGEKLTYQEFQQLVDEFTEVIKMTQGRDNLNEDELNQLRDQVWNNYIQNALISGEAKKLGLQVTDDEMRDILNEGTEPMLRQTPFVNQQTQRFDANLLKQFLSEYKKAETTNPQALEQYRSIYNYWKFIEKSIRQQKLAEKYQALFASCFISNKIEAKQAYNDEINEASIELASFSFNDVKDKDVKVSESDLKAKYEEMKPMFRQYIETRDIKYVSVKVAASSTDRAALNKQVADYASQLATAEDPSEVVRKSGSSVAYLGIPVLKTAFPADIQNELDSIAVGTTSAMKENAMDNTLNVVRLISKQELPDSVEFQTIQLAAQDAEAAHKSADSVMTAITADATQWEAQAKKYGQTGDKQWLTTQQYQFAPSLDADTKTYLYALNTMNVGEVRNIKTATGNIIVKVTDRKAFKTKYVAAVIKSNINFSKDTYSQAYNKFSRYVSENQNLEGIEKGAKKYGYQVLENKNVANTSHLIAGIHGTHDALKWVFDAKEGEVSPLYECGENDNLLVLVMTKINKEGYLTLDNEEVKNVVEREAINDKKAELLMAKAQGVKKIADAKAKGAKVEVIQQITFAAPAFISSTGSAEPALSGAVAATAQGKLSKPVKGNNGVYVFTVIKKAPRNGAKFDEKTYTQRLAQRSMQAAGNFMQELYINANVKDNRYLFF